MSESVRRAPKVSKDKVNYRKTTSQARRCGTCSMFRRQDHRNSTGSCTLVTGQIDSRDVCDRWERR